MKKLFWRATVPLVAVPMAVTGVIVAAHGLASLCAAQWILDRWHDAEG